MSPNVEDLVAECVCTHNKHRGKPTMVIIYLAKWAGYGPDHSTWEPEVNIADPYLIAEFARARCCTGTCPAHAPKHSAHKRALLQQLLCPSFCPPQLKQANQVAQP